MSYEIDILPADNTTFFYKLIASLWVCMVRHVQSIQGNNFIISSQYLKENVKDGGLNDFSLLIIVKRFFRVILSFLMCVARITRNRKFVISLQYLKREVNGEVDFLHPGKHEKLLQIDTMILRIWSIISKFPKIASLQCLYNISEKKIVMMLVFCMQISIKVAYKLISTVWAPKLAKR